MMFYEGIWQWVKTKWYNGTGNTKLRSANSLFFNINNLYTIISYKEVNFWKIFNKEIFLKKNTIKRGIFNEKAKFLKNLQKKRFIFFQTNLQKKRKIYGKREIFEKLPEKRKFLKKFTEKGKFLKNLHKMGKFSFLCKF